MDLIIPALIGAITGLIAAYGKDWLDYRKELVEKISVQDYDAVLDACSNFRTQLTEDFQSRIRRKM